MDLQIPFRIMKINEINALFQLKSAHRHSKADFLNNFKYGAISNLNYTSKTLFHKSIKSRYGRHVFTFKISQTIKVSSSQCSH